MYGAAGALMRRGARACAARSPFRRAHAQRALLQLSVDLCVVYASRRPDQVTDTFLSDLHALWSACCPDRKPPPPQEITLPERREDLSPEFRNFEDEDGPVTPVSDEEADGPPLVMIADTGDSEPGNSECIANAGKPEAEQGNELLEFFDRILCPRNIVLLSETKCSEVWEAMATVLVFLLKNYYLTEDSLTEQCLAVYRQDWPQATLENLSTCMKSVSSRWSRSSTGKFTLFLDFLAEYCGDMDCEPLD